MKRRERHEVKGRGGMREGRGVQGRERARASEVNERFAHFCYRSCCLCYPNYYSSYYSYVIIIIPVLMLVLTLVLLLLLSSSLSLSLASLLYKSFFVRCWLLMSLSLF